MSVLAEMLFCSAAEIDEWETAAPAKRVKVEGGWSTELQATGKHLAMLPTLTTPDLMPKSQRCHAMSCHKASSSSPQHKVACQGGEEFALYISLLRHSPLDVQFACAISTLTLAQMQQQCKQQLLL